MEKKQKPNRIFPSYFRQDDDDDDDEEQEKKPV